MKLKYYALLSIGLIFSNINSSYADGALMVLPISMSVSDESPHTVTVKNTGDEAMYLKVELQKVLNPGDKNEKKVIVSSLPSPGLIAFPAKLALGPNQSKKLTINPLYSPEKEEVYRLYILPVRNYQVVEETSDKINAPVVFALGYGALIPHTPEVAKQVQDWSARCNGQGMILTNTGNTRVLFSSVQAGNKSAKIDKSIAVFPGTPQQINSTAFIAKVDNKSVIVKCD